MKPCREEASWCLTAKARGRFALFILPEASHRMPRFLLGAPSSAPCRRRPPVSPRPSKRASNDLMKVCRTLSDDIKAIALLV
jgi:hypothetical protein